jgi:hypothetical protein
MSVRSDLRARVARRVLRPVVLAAAVAAAAPALAAGVDESALRWYAAHGETERAASEIRRLQLLYPEWVPPTDLAAAPVDREAPLWALFAADDLAGLEAEITRLKAADPGFELSPDLSAKIALKTARRDLIAASDRGDHRAVLAAAAAQPTLGGCADLDVAWRVAEARASAGAPADAEAAYRNLLADCTDPAERRATVEKALALLGPAAARPLLALEKTPGEFASLRVAFGRAAVAAALAGPAASPVDPAEVAAFTESALAGPGPADAALLGWWRRAEGDHAGALAAFEAAATFGGSTLDPKTVEGLVLSLKDLGRTDEALRIAGDRRTMSPELAALFVGLGAARLDGDPRPVLDAAFLAAYGDAVQAARDPAAAEAIAWWAYDRGDAAAARRWFDVALGFGDSESAARGAVYAALAAKDRDAARALVDRWAPRFPQLAEIAFDQPKAARPAGRDPMVVAFERKDFAACLRHATKGRLKPGQSLIHGWCLLEMGRPVEAAAAFEKAEAGPAKVRADAVYGRSLALIAAGHVEAGAEVAAGAVDDPKRRAEIGVAVLADRAQARFDAKDWRGALTALDQRAAFAAEPARLSLLRGWSLWHLGRKAEARDLFRDLDRAYSTRETRRALATVENAS